MLAHVLLKLSLMPRNSGNLDPENESKSHKIKSSQKSICYSAMKLLIGASPEKSTVSTVPFFCFVGGGGPPGIGHFQCSNLVVRNVTMAVHHAMDLDA